MQDVLCRTVLMNPGRMSEESVSSERGKKTLHFCFQRLPSHAWMLAQNPHMCMHAFNPSAPYGVHLGSLAHRYLYRTTVSQVAFMLLQSISWDTSIPASIHVWQFSSWGLYWILAFLYLFFLSPSISSHFINLLSPLSHPLSIRPLLFDLPSLLPPRLPLSPGSGYREVSLSLMTVGLLSARPPLCPQPARLSRGTGGQEGREGVADCPTPPKQTADTVFNTVSFSSVASIWSPVQLLFPS